MPHRYMELPNIKWIISVMFLSTTNTIPQLKEKFNVLLVGPAPCFFLFLPTLLRKLHGDACCTEPSETFRVRPSYDYEKKTCES